MEAAKYYYLMVAVVMAMVVIGSGVMEWHKMDCKIAMAQKNFTPEQIESACK